MNSSNNFLNTFKTLVVSGLLTSNLFMSDLYSQSVGINTDGSAPSELLHIKGGKVLIEGRNNILIDPDGAESSGSIYGLSIKSSMGSWSLGNYAHNGEGISLGGFYMNGSDNAITKFVIGKPSAEKLTVLSSGNVGIGIADPSTSLDISGGLRIRELNQAGLVITSASGNVDKLAYGTTSQYLRGDGTWQTPTPPGEISICEFLSFETVYNSGGKVFFVVPAGMDGKTITKAIAKGASGDGSTTVTISKNGTPIASGTITGVGSTTATQSGDLSTTIATGDVISVSASATSGTLRGLTATISVR